MLYPISDLVEEKWSLRAASPRDFAAKPVMKHFTQISVSKTPRHESKFWNTTLSGSWRTFEIAQVASWRILWATYHDNQRAPNHDVTLSAWRFRFGGVPPVARNSQFCFIRSRRARAVAAEG